MKNILKLLSIVVVLMLTGCQKEYTITAVANDASMGTVIGGGVYKKGTTIELVAKPASNCYFEKWQDGNTENPRSVMVQSDAMYIATFTSGGEEPTNRGGISVSATQKVYFSPGNLQWSASGIHAVAGGGAEAGTWRFAPNQWDIIGADNKNISSTYTDWIDLFGWGTSGYNNKYPYMTSTKETDYGNGGKNIFNTNYDWGVYNAIYNPKTNTTDAPGTWRTLTKDEWEYLLDTRATASSIRYAKGTVCGIAGLIIVPDDWKSSIYSLNNVNIVDVTYTSNIIDTSDWAKMEDVGCVFLPAAGYRYGTSVVYVGSCGNYWSTIYADSYNAYVLGFGLTNLYSTGSSYCNGGNSVRLVRWAQ